ncbi:hypothetical protein M8J76_010475 [Diaphorina citri]|nr:hypothetical protein M8J76_010475 [Diaphorina citri]
MNSQNVGNYECRASNVAGSDTNAFQIQLHEPPTIKEPWTSYQEVLEGSSVQLPCLAEGELTPTYSWSAEGKPINNSNRWYVTRNGSFVINNIAEKDTNVYTCTVSNAAGSTSKTIQMNVLVPPFFKDEQQESVAIVVNHPMNISCSHYGVPTPDFSWYKDGSLLRIQSHYITLGSQVNDSGLYSCYVKNKAGEINRKVNLTVLATPVIEKDNSPATRKVINGENITLNCTIAQGYPIPKIVWFKDGRPISAWFKLLNKGEQLVLENMNSQNVGNYECRASNIAGSDTNAFHIQLHEPPTIKEPWTSYQEVLEGSSVQLPCLAEGDLTLTFSWSAEGKPINDSSKWYVARNGSLIMSHVSEEDTNAYTCTVSNAVGSTSKTIQMNVLVPPFFKDEQQENVAVVVNHPVNISCSHYGVPTPDFIWYKDDTLLRIESLYITLGSQVNDRGVYSCYVKNKAGEISRKINMTVLEPPSIHRDSQEKITVVQGNSVGLICNASGYPTPKISWNSSVAALEENSQISFTGNELRLFNVTANMSGKITCDAENAVGVDHKTFELEVTVPPKIQENGISPNLTLKEGEVFSIPCIATGNPDPQISWHIQSKSRTIHSGYHEDNMLVLTDNTLVLTEVSANDTYTCVASNSAGIDKKNYSITIEENPIYVTDPEVEQVNVMESDTVQMECDVDEDTPVDHWLINGKPIPKIIKIERGDEIHFSYSEDKHVLSVLNVPDSSFNGIYQCVDETGKVIKSFKLNVLSTPQFDSDASFKSDIIVEQGSKVSMNCSANGFPKPLVTWKKISPTGELPVTEHTVPDIIFEPPQFNYVLHFPSVQTKHSGLYQCTAANDIEQSDDYRVSRQFNLQVLEPPFIRNKPATDLVQIEQNSELKLSCDVEGNPTPEIMWHRAGAQIDSSAVKEVVPPDEGINTFRIISTLSIPNIQTEQRGEFACIASNKIGVAEQSFHVTVNAT